MRRRDLGEEGRGRKDEKRGRSVGDGFCRKKEIIVLEHEMGDKTRDTETRRGDSAVSKCENGLLVRMEDGDIGVVSESKIVETIKRRCSESKHFSWRVKVAGHANTIVDIPFGFREREREGCQIEIGIGAVERKEMRSER